MTEFKEGQKVYVEATVVEEDRNSPELEIEYQAGKQCDYVPNNIIHPIPEPVELPEIVAAYIQDSKSRGDSLKEAFMGTPIRVYNFLTSVVNSDLFARAWLDGYVVKREPKVHELKIEPIYFKDVKSGLKKFEIRKNDRDYQVGDVVALHEYDPSGAESTGNSLRTRITYLTDYAQQDGYVVLGIEPVESE